MAQNQEPIVTRPRLLLDNSAAEFVETRAGRYLGPAFAMPNGSEFAPNLDKFVNKEDSDSLKIEKYYQASKQKAIEFEGLLIKFAKLVEDRQMDKKFDIKSKSIDTYRMEDVTEIAEKIQAKHQNTSIVRDCTGIFRKCFNCVGQSQGTLSNLLSFVPNDSYGSVICGGFTMVLTAIERAEKLRENMYKALAEIPRKLELIHSLTNCHRQSINIYEAGDSVLVALFRVLGMIINELTKSKRRKAISMLFKGKSYASDLDSALASLENKINDFKNQVLICNSKRLGEMGESQSRVEESQVRVEKLLNVIISDKEELKSTQASIASLQSAPSMTIEEQRFMKQKQRDADDKEYSIDVLTKLYRCLASSPSFDAHSGGYLPPASEKAPEKPPKVRNEELANDWLEALTIPFHTLAIQDMSEVLEGLPLLSIDDQGKVQYIMSCPCLIEWLNTNGSKTLLIQSEMAPQTLINPLSFSSAFLVRILSDTYKSPVLYYNCGFRSVDSLDAELSGPLALINTFNAQLVHHLSTWHEDTMDTSCLDQQGVSKSPEESYKRDLKQSRTLFRRLLKQLPRSDIVFVVIDGFSRITGDDTLVDQVLQGLLSLASHPGKRRFKLLLTDILSRTVLNQHKHSEIYVHDRIDSGGQSLNLQFLSQETQGSLARSN